MKNAADYEVIEFRDQPAFRKWLADNYVDTQGIWLKIYKKASGIDTVSYAEALDTALCFGWIDGQKKALDEISFLQKFTPRRQRSMWSRRNIEHIARLTAEGLMEEAGLREVQRAKDDGRWDAAYAPPSEMEVPEYFIKELKNWPKAEAFFKTLGRSDRYSIAWRLHTVKTQAGRDRRTQKMIELLNEGKRIT